jgi:ligand-binding sensor domain-containing protein
VDRYGSVWVGTDEGLYRSTPEGGWVHLTTANGLASNHVLAIFEDSEGTFWIGTPGGISSVTIEK